MNDGDLPGLNLSDTASADPVDGMLERWTLHNRKANLGN